MARTTLLVEGWRTSCHSYALVNQHQLLHLLADERFQVFHHDVPFFRPHWAGIDSGLPDADKARLAAIPGLPDAAAAEVTFRISYPFRIHPASGRTFVFATNELHLTLREDTVGGDGTHASVEHETVDIVTPSSWSRRAFLEAGYAAERVHVIPHGVTLGPAQPASATQRASWRRSLGIAADAFVFLNIGAMTWNKGIGPLLAAFAVHRRSHPQAVLLLKGGDALYGNVLKAAIDEAGRLRAEARDPGLEAALRYLPQVLSTELMSCLYGACDAYVAPYRAEGFNLPVLESMAAGLPVLVTGGGATDDFCPETAGLRIAADVAEGARGRYLEPRLASIVEQMARVTADSGLRARLAAAGRDSAARLAWPAVTARLSALLLG